LEIKYFIKMPLFSINNLANKRSVGFTLVELIVVVFIFLNLVLILGGDLFSVMVVQRKAINMKKVEENGRFVLEMISREIRAADPLNQSISDGCYDAATTQLSFTHPVNGNITYSYDSSNKAVLRNFQQISNPDVEVTKFKFCLSGNATGDKKQPRITIILSLEAGQQRDKATLNLQTTISPRVRID